MDDDEEEDDDDSGGGQRARSESTRDASVGRSSTLRDGTADVTSARIGREGRCRKRTQDGSERSRDSREGR